MIKRIFKVGGAVTLQATFQDSLFITPCTNRYFATQILMNTNTLPQSHEFINLLHR